MTKVIVIGENNQPENEKKKIELLKFLSSKIEIIIDAGNISNYKYVELICKDYTDGNDMIFCYNNPDNRSVGTLFLGHWNDGVV